MCELESSKLENFKLIFPTASRSLFNCFLISCVTHMILLISFSFLYLFPFLYLFFPFIPLSFFSPFSIFLHTFLSPLFFLMHFHLTFLLFLHIVLLCPN